MNRDISDTMEKKNFHLILLAVIRRHNAVECASLLLLVPYLQITSTVTTPHTLLFHLDHQSKLAFKYKFIKYKHLP